MSWRVEYDQDTAWIVGPSKAEARRRIAACGDASPIWTARRGAWATSTEVANRVLDQLEGRHIGVVVEDTAQGVIL